jgi:hypothetical protein
MLKFYDVFCISVKKLCSLHSKRHKHSIYSLCRLIAKRHHFSLKRKGYFMKFPLFFNMFSPRTTSAKKLNRKQNHMAKIPSLDC